MSQTKSRNSLHPFLLPSQLLSALLGHRGLLHSLLGCLLFTLLTFVPLGLVLRSVPAILALCVGYGSHLVFDACTKHGIPLWFPSNKQVHFLPSWLRITTGSAAEEPVFVLLALLSVVLLLFANLPMYNIPGWQPLQR